MPGSPVESDRRVHIRFPSQHVVRYKFLYGEHLAEVGEGHTLNMSSKGVAFTTETMLAPGLPLELSVDWPALLNGSVSLKLMLYGIVLRSDQQAAVMSITRSEYRTQRARTT